MSAIGQALAAHATSQAEAVALQGEDIALSYADAWRLIEDAVPRLQHVAGIRAVGVCVDHSPESLLLVIALIEAGVAHVPLPAFFTASQRENALRESGAAWLIEDSVIANGRIEWASKPTGFHVRPLPEGTALVSFTSGSTGHPKGICLSAAHLAATAASIVDFLGDNHRGRHLSLLPFGILLEFVAGQLAELIAGGTVIARPASAVGLANPFQPDPAALCRAIGSARATSLILVPEYLALLVGAMEQSGVRFGDLTMVAVGGARVSQSLLDGARAVGLPVRQGYGLTETGSVVALERSTGEGGVGGSMGLHQLTLADDGEIMIDGPLFLGTIGQPRPPGAYATGDVGRYDDSGSLHIVGRKSNMIVTSFGRNVAPEWVEGLLVEQPEIFQAMVRGDGHAVIEALIVPASTDADPAAAVERVNMVLPPYARIGTARPVPPFTPVNGQLTPNGRLRRSAVDAAYPPGTSVMTFFEQLVSETAAAQARFVATPQLIAGLTGTISRADYIAYLTQAYHHVRHTVPLMQEARASLLAQGDDRLVAALDEYIEEETGHEEWILDDIDAAGGDREAARLSEPNPATRTMVDHAYETIRTGHPAAFFGMVYVLEGTSIAMATNGAEAVERSLGLPKTAFRYLNSHGALDQEHMAFFETLVNGIDDPAQQDDIIAMARDMFGLFGGLFASIDLEGVRHAA